MQALITESTKASSELVGGEKFRRVDRLVSWLDSLPHDKRIYCIFYSHRLIAD